MGEEKVIRVRLHRYTDRPIGLIWQCGDRSGEVSSGYHREADALKAAGRLEERLAAGILPGSSRGLRITWADFRVRYETEWLDGMSYGSRKGWKQAADHFERICNPAFLADVDKSMLSRYRAELEAKVAPTSARSYYRALRAGLGWAETVDLIDQVPRIRHRKVGRHAATMRSRVVTAEEFDRLIAKLRLDKEGKKRADAVAFERFAQGLWYSGLRIDELNRMRWEPSHPLHVRLEGKLPLIVFLGEQKNASDTYLPAPREFWQLIDRPGIPRNGHVFPIAGRWGTQMTTRNIGREISDAGRLAGIIVDPRSQKCASAHDLRASYLTRMAPILQSNQLQSLARHSDPKTTSQFYIRHEAEELAKAAGWT
jgi:integrase